MQLSNYQSLATLTAVYPKRNTIYGLAYTSLGLSGEVGEFANKVKKVMRGDKEYDEQTRQDLSEELGGILWYLSQCANELNVSLDTIAEENISILQSRMERGKIHGDGDNR